MRLFFGSVFGAIFMIVIGAIILVGIIKLFRLKVNQEDVEGCFSIIGFIAFAITFMVFVLNKCSEAGW